LGNRFTEVEGVAFEGDFVEVVFLELELFLLDGVLWHEAERERLVDADRQVFARHRAALHDRGTEPAARRERIALAFEPDRRLQLLDGDDPEAPRERHAFVGGRLDRDRRRGDLALVDRPGEFGRAHSSMLPVRTAWSSRCASLSANDRKRRVNDAVPWPSSIVTFRSSA